MNINVKKSLLLGGVIIFAIAISYQTHNILAAAEDESLEDVSAKFEAALEPPIVAAEVTTPTPVALPNNPSAAVVLTDSDKDGLSDDKDPHPQIAEVFIVTDDNRNGIVDKFELTQ